MCLNRSNGNVGLEHCKLDYQTRSKSKSMVVSRKIIRDSVRGISKSVIKASIMSVTKVG